MNVIVIPDVHQTTIWKDIVLKYYDYYDYIIQVGDWFDTHDADFDWDECNPVENFKQAVELSKQFPKFKICLGNHDFSYLLDSHCSEFQWSHYKEIRDVLLKYIQDVNIAYELDGWVISHAGFTKTWMTNNGFTTVEEVNKALHDGNYEIFQFRGLNIYGDDPENGPCWVRPASLYEDAYFKYQVVGHTPTNDAPLVLDCRDEITNVLKPAIDGQVIILIDDENHTCIYNLDTEADKND